MLIRNAHLSVAFAMAITACSAEPGLNQDAEPVASTAEALNKVLPTQKIFGDFDGDGRGDVIIQNVYGSYEYMGLPNGGFTPNAWSNTNFTILNTTYTVGDFDGDGASDFIATTSSGSYLYTGIPYFTKPGGSFIANVWTRADWSIGTVRYTVGNFDGDPKQKDELIVTTAGGSGEYFWTPGPFGTSAFDLGSWNRPDLTLATTTYTVGNFNCDTDTTDDVIISNQFGSYEYTGIPGGEFTGGFTPNVWARTDLPSTSTAFTVGNFNGSPGGDACDDIIITTNRGSFYYLGQKAGGFTPTNWQRTDLPLGLVSFVPGDFNGDGAEDLIITTPGGSYEYAGSTSNQLNPTSWSRTDLTLGNQVFWASDFTGDQKTDLIITNTSGSYEYLGVWPSGFQPNVWVRTDLASPYVRYN
jgi:hypothetical protein